MADEQCPKCNSVNVYHDGTLWICPECAHEWTPSSAHSEATETIDDSTIRDSNGNVLVDGDSVTTIKDLKIKGAASTIKSGTKIRNIRLTQATDGHNVSCKIDGVGSVNLKSEFLKKA